MADFVISKDCTPAKVKTAVKAEVMEVIYNALVEKYGTDGVAMVLTGKSKVKEIGVMVKEVDCDGETVWACATVNASAKDFVNRSTDKKGFIPAFDFYEAKNAYENKMAEDEIKAAEKAAIKEKKIASDTKRREAKKAKEDLVDF